MTTNYNNQIKQKIKQSIYLWEINENHNVFRKDEIISESDKDELLANAPSQDEGMFRIPKVIN